MLGRLLLWGLGAALAVGAIAAIVIAVKRLSSNTIREELIKQHLNEAIIKNISEYGEDQLKVSVGLLDSYGDEKKVIEYHADEIERNLYEGMKIYA